MSGRPKVGSVGWLDLTVDDAEEVGDFYRRVVGWDREPVAMEAEGETWNDFNMTTADGTPVAGVCHRRGPNADLPPVWMAYVVVVDLASRLEACRELGGDVVAGPKQAGGGRYAVIRDPAGAVLALYEAPPEAPE